MKVEVKEYNEKWPQMFKDEAEKIKAVFVNELIDIHHIGSTSVRDLKAKPIIDIMPVVKHIENVDLFNLQMTEIGYEPLGEFGIEGRRYFRKGRDNRTHQVHVFQADNKYDIDRHLAVRDYLRTYYEARKKYENLKNELAEKFPNDIESYVSGKDRFVKDLEKKTLIYYKEQ